MTIPTSLPRLLPNTDGLLIGWLRPALPGVQVVTYLSPAEQLVYPVLLVRRVGGGRVHPRLLDAPLVAVDSFARTRPGAESVAERAVQVFEYAWQEQLVGDDGQGLSGHIGHLEVDEAPNEMRDRDSPADLYRYNAMFSMLIRPS